MTDNNKRLESELLSVAEVAQLLDCNKQTVYALIKEEYLDVVRVGRLFKIKRSEVNKFINTGGAT